MEIIQLINNKVTEGWKEIVTLQSPYSPKILWKISDFLYYNQKKKTFYISDIEIESDIIEFNNDFAYFSKLYEKYYKSDKSKFIAEINKIRDKFGINILENYYFKGTEEEFNYFMYNRDIEINEKFIPNNEDFEDYEFTTIPKTTDRFLLGVLDQLGEEIIYADGIAIKYEDAQNYFGELQLLSYLNGLTLRYGKLYGNYRYITTKEFTEKQLQIAISRYVFISRQQRIQC